LRSKRGSRFISRPPVDDADRYVEITTDERGRITIPKAVRERFGERYRLVELEDGIKLMPVPDDPLESLRNAASDELSCIHGRRTA